MTRTLRRCFSRALLPLAALALVGCDETGNTPVADDALSHADTPAAVEVSESVNSLTIAEFRGLYDPAIGLVEFEMLERDAWETPTELRVAEQAHEGIRLTAGGGDDTGTLSADSVCFGASACGVTGPLFDALGVFAFNATFTSYFDYPVGAVAAVLTYVSTPEYNGYTYESSYGFYGADESQFSGPNAPADLGVGGPFLFGDVGAFGSASVPWGFLNGGGAFSFSGRIIGDLPDICGNGVDDNYNGRVDEGCSDVAQGGACLEDADCTTGFCFGASGVTEGTCELGGCMDSNASNFDGAATHDDGSCTYLQTFYVSTACSSADLSSDTVYVVWLDADGNEQVQELTDVSGVGVYSGVVTMPAGDTNYFYVTGAPGETNPTRTTSEDLTGGSCSTSIAGWSWRDLNVSAQADINDNLGTCGNCYIIDPFEDQSVSATGTVSRTLAWSTVMGRRSDFHANEVSAYVVPFQMPNLVTGESVQSATLRFGLYNSAGSGPGFPHGTDLYGLGARTTAIPVAADFFEGALDASSTLLADELIPANTLVPAHDSANTYQVSVTDAALTTYVTDNYAGGEYLVFRLNPDEAMPVSGDQFIQFLTGGAGQPGERPRFTIATDFSGTPGCTDANANNYDATAGYDNGSCMYDAVFCVDMGCPNPDTPFTNVYLTGPDFGWCADCVPLTPDTGNIHCTGTLSLPAGDLIYKFQTDSWNDQENLVDDMQGGASCAPDTNYFDYANRRVTIDGTTATFNDTYGSCDACPQGTIMEITGSNADARPHNAFGYDPAGFNQITDPVTSVGEYYTQRSSPVFPFVIPEINSAGTIFSANVKFDVQTRNGIALLSDVYARIALTDDAFGAADFYAGVTQGIPNGQTPELNDWALVQNDFIDSSTGAGTLELSETGQTRLAALLQEYYDSTSLTAGTSLLIRLSPSDTTTTGWNDVVIFTADAGADNRPTLTLDQTGLSYGVVPVAGCMDSAANNYNASATTSDGSCIYDITFVLDTSCADPALAETAGWYPLVHGPRWGWDTNQIDGQMTQVDPTTWSVTIPLQQGTFEYKYFDMASQGNDNGQENLVDDMQGGASCATVTDYNVYANREIAITGDATVSDIYGRCGTCPSATITDYSIVTVGDDETHERGGGVTVGDDPLDPTWRNLVGEYWGGGAAATFPFELPTLADDEYIVSSEFHFMVNEVIYNGGNIAGNPAQSLDWNVDLYGLDYRATGTVLPADHFRGGANDAANTLVVEQLLLGDHSVTPPNQVSTTDSGITDYLNAQLAAGGNGQWVFLRMNADADPTTFTPAYQQFHILSSRAANAVEWPTLNFQTERCNSGEFVDCTGACVAGDPATLRGDLTCDDGSTGADLNCSRYNFDDGDCGSACPSGTSLGCDGVTCVNDANFGNGVCDANLDCDDTAYDHFDCTSASQSTCGAGELIGADGLCYARATYVGTFADSTCQPYENSGAYAFGGGDCCVGGNTAVDCDGNTVCDPSTGWGSNRDGDGFCDSLHTGGFGNFLCSAEGYESGDCAGSCGAGQVPTCDQWSTNPAGTCVAAETMTAALANSTLDADYNCGWYRFDNGQGGASGCSAPGQVYDCDGVCLTDAALTFLGDTAFAGGCDSSAPNFECADWGFDAWVDGGPDCTPNLFTNGNFEAGTTGWLTYGTSNWASQVTGTPYYLSGDTFTALEGNEAGKQWCNGAAEANIFQAFEGANTLTPGQSYMFTGNMFRATQEPFAGSPRVEAFFKYFCAGYSCADVFTVPVLDDYSPSNEWVPFSLCTTMPADRPIQQVGMFMLGGTGGTAWYDDMKLEPVASCPGAVNASVASLTHSNTNTYDVIQVTGADTASTPSGTPSAGTRTVYGYTPDGTGAPTWTTGTVWPYVVLPDGAPVTKDGAVAANIGTRHVAGVGRILTVNGVPAYQYTWDNATQMEGAFITDWMAFTPVGSAVTGGAPQVFGCTDSDAYNYNAAATDDDGSCTYEVTFVYDMNCANGQILPSNANIHVQGTFNDECATGGTATCGGGEWWEGPELSDDDGDGVFEGSIVMPPGAWGYVGSVATIGSGGWEHGQENLTGSTACNNAPAADQRPLVVTDAPVTLSHTWNSCDTSCSAYAVNWCNLQFPSTISGAAGSDQTAYSQLYIAGLTDNSTYDNPETWPRIIDVELMFGATGGDVASFDAFSATTNTNQGNNWEYQATAALPAAGTYDYAFRISTDNGSTWTYCFEDGPQASTSGDRGVATSF